MQDPNYFGGNETWVAKFLSSLPLDSFVRNYVGAAAAVTDANAGFHIAGALTLLSQTCPLNFGLGENRATANVYALLTGSSASRKTEAIRVARSVARAAGLDTITKVPTPGSREGFMDSLTRYPQQAILYDEFASFLGVTSAGGRGRHAGHAVALRDAIMQGYDDVPNMRQLATRRARDGSTVEEVRGSPTSRVSILAAANYRVLSQYTTGDDWLNGFMGRFLLVDGELERFYTRKRPWPEALYKCAQQLRWLAGYGRPGRIAEDPPEEGSADGAALQRFPCYDLTREADGVFDEWASGIELRRRREENEMMLVALGRATDLAMRLAVLLAWDYGIQQERPYEPWQVGVNVLNPAIFLTERHLEAYAYAAANVVVNESYRPVKDVEGVIRRADNDRRGLTSGEIARAVSLPLRTVDDALMTLAAMNVVKRMQRPNVMAFEWWLVGGLRDRVVEFRDTDQLGSSGESNISPP